MYIYIYSLAKLKEQKTRDLNQVSCIKNEEDRVLVVDKDFKERCRSYFDKLMNGPPPKVGDFETQEVLIKMLNTLERYEYQKFEMLYKR